MSLPKETMALIMNQAVDRLLSMFDPNGIYTPYKEIIVKTLMDLANRNNKPSDDMERDEGSFLLMRSTYSGKGEDLSVTDPTPMGFFSSRTAALDMCAAYNKRGAEICYPERPLYVFDVISDQDIDGDDGSVLDLKRSLETAQEALHKSYAMSDDPSGAAVNLHIETAIQQVDVALEKLELAPGLSN